MLLFIDVLLLCVFLAGYLAFYIHPRHAWWLQALAPGLPLLSIALLVAAAITAILNKWGLCGVHLMFLVCALFRFASPQEVFRRPSGEQEHLLTLISFNAKNHHSSIAASDQAMEVLIEREQPHLVGLQEVAVWFLNKPQRRGSDYHIRVLFQKYRILRPDSANAGAPYKFHMPIFSNLVQTEAVPLHNLSVTPHSSTTLSGTRGLFSWRGQQFALYNIHLRSFTPDTAPPQSLTEWLDPLAWMKRIIQYRADFLIRAQEAEHLRLLLDREKLPFIVMGDFNSTPHNWVYRHIARGLQDAHKVAGSGSGASFPSYLPFFRIDYILTSPDWAVHSTYVVPSDFSDHLPVVARVELRSPAQ